MRLHSSPFWPAFKILGVIVTARVGCIAQAAHALSLSDPAAESSSPIDAATHKALPELSLLPGRFHNWVPDAKRCVTAVATQKSNRLWVATEDSGVWTCSLDKNSTSGWQQYLSVDGLEDDHVYALAVDRQDRVWAGTLNHGVSVWNGESWKNYGVLDGPLGERVFDIEVCPTDGDVWVATNVGLSRYSESTRTWSYITRVEGLPSDQVQALAFAANGDLIVGLQHDGIALSESRTNYGKWHLIRGPQSLPLTALGDGLPSGMINDVLVARDGTIYAGTTEGLAWSLDHGKKWSFVRGKDYASKVQGLITRPSKNWSLQPGAVLSEDYVSCLAEDDKANLWIGHRQAGHEVLAIRPGSLMPIQNVIDREESGNVRAILPIVHEQPIVARYNEGLSQGFSETADSQFVTDDQTQRLVKSSRDEASPTQPTLQVNDSAVRPSAPFPARAGAPSISILKKLLKSVRNHEVTPSDAPPIVAVSDDWKTQGQWQGRYGRYWAGLGALTGPRDYIWGAGDYPIYYDVQIAKSLNKEEKLRRVVHSVYNERPESLEMPTIYLDSRIAKRRTTGMQPIGEDKNRRQSGWEDHGEAYPMSQEGPGLSLTVRIPGGLYYLSLYNNNFDGDQGASRARDLKISIRPHDYEKPLSDITDFQTQPQFISGRMHDFRGGYYTRYLVKGPRDLTIQVDRNNSYNTILSGIFLDDISEEPDPYFKISSPTTKAFPLLSPQNSKSKEDAAAEELWAAIETTKTKDPLWWGSTSRESYQALARYYRETEKRVQFEQDKELWRRLGTCFYHLNLFPEWETLQERRGLKTARSIEKSLKWDQISNFNGKGRQTIVAVQSGTSVTDAVSDDNCACHSGYKPQ